MSDPTELNRQINDEKKKRDWLSVVQVLLLRREGKLKNLRVRSKRSRKQVNLNQPLVYLTPEQSRFADDAMRLFREEDR